MKLHRMLHKCVFCLIQNTIITIFIPFILLIYDSITRWIGKLHVFANLMSSYNFFISDALYIIKTRIKYILICLDIYSNISIIELRLMFYSGVYLDIFMKCYHDFVKYSLEKDTLYNFICTHTNAYTFNLKS